MDYASGEKSYHLLSTYTIHSQLTLKCNMLRRDKFSLRNSQHWSFVNHNSLDLHNPRDWKMWKSIQYQGDVCESISKASFSNLLTLCKHTSLRGLFQKLLVHFHSGQVIQHTPKHSEGLRETPLIVLFDIKTCSVNSRNRMLLLAIGTTLVGKE